MCGGSDNNTSTSTTTQSMPPWLQQNYQNLMGQAQGVAAEGYQAYPGQRVAPLTGQQQALVQGVDQLQYHAQPYFDQSQSYAQQAGQNVAGNYYNPTGFTTQNINVPTITPQQAQAQYAQTQYAPAAAQAQAQQAQANFAHAQQSGYAQTQAPNNVYATQIGPKQVATGQFNQQAFNQYGSPYQQDVINSTMGELNRQQTLDQNNATSQATLAGAFGGDRAAVQQAEIGRDYGQVKSQALANLNNQNWQQAQNMFTSDQARGLQAQGMNQSALLQAGQANQAANLQAALANQGWQGNVGLANMGAANTAQLQNAQLGTQAALTNAGLGTQTSQFNAGLGTQNSQFNAGLSTQNNQFNAGQGNQVGMYNAGLGTQNSQFNTGLNYTGQAQNAANSLQAQQFMAGQNLQAQQLSDQSNQYYASLAAADRNRQLAVSQQMGNLGTASDAARLQELGALAGTGAMEQGQVQQNMDTAYQDFLAQRQYPFQTTSWLSGIYSGTPTPINSSGTYTTPGPSMTSQLAGAGLSAAALYGMYGAKDGGMIRKGLGAGIDTMGHRHWTGQPTHYAAGGIVSPDDAAAPGPAQQQPMSFWGAGPNGISPALQIGLAIMGGQSPHALTNIGQGALQGIQAQQQAGMQNAEANLWKQQGRKLKAEADVMEGDQEYDRKLNALLSGKGSQMIPAGKKGGAMVSGLPGTGPSEALPGAGPPPSAPAAPGAASAAPVTPPAPNAPAPAGAPVGDVQAPAPQAAPAGGGMIPPAQPAPAAAVPQTPPSAPSGPPVPSVASGPAPEAPPLRPSAQMAQAQGVTMQDVAQVNQNFPQLARDQKLLTALQDPSLGPRMSPRAMNMMEAAQKRIDKIAETGRALDANGNFAVVPSWLTAKVQEDYASAYAKGQGELPSKLAYVGAEKNLDLRNQMAVQGAITRREFGLVPLRGAEERKTQKEVAAFKIPLEAQFSGPKQFQFRDPNNPNNVYEGSGTNYDFAKLSAQGGAGGMAGPPGGGAQQPPPTTDAAPEGMPPVPGGGKLGAMPAPTAPPTAVGGMPVGRQVLNPEQTKESSDLGEMRKQITDEAKAGNMMRARTKELLDVMPTVEMGAGADAKTQWGRWALAFGASPDWVKNNIQNVPGAEIMAKGLNDLVSKQIKEVGREPGMVWQMFKSANPQLETQPESTKLLLNVLDADSKRLEDRSGAFESWTASGRSAKGFSHWFDQNYDARHYMDMAYQKTYGLPEGSTFAGNSKADGSMMFKTPQGVVKVAPMKTSKPAAVESLMPGVGGAP